MSTVYLWDGEKVIEWSSAPFTLRNAIKHDLLDMVSFDPTDFGEFQYGKFIIDKGWLHVPFEQFPPEFRTHLLLLGVA